MNLLKTNLTEDYIGGQFHEEENQFLPHLIVSRVTLEGMNLICTQYSYVHNNPQTHQYNHNHYNTGYHTQFYHIFLFSFFFFFFYSTTMASDLSIIYLCYRITSLMHSHMTLSNHSKYICNGV